MKIWYILVCRECDPTLDAPLPFRSAEERGRWAGEHRRGTGHDRWLVIDQSERAIELAQQFHDTYERLAPQFAYETRPAPAVSFDSVPGKNRLLMIEVAGVILARRCPYQHEIPERKEETT